MASTHIYTQTNIPPLDVNHTVDISSLEYLRRILSQYEILSMIASHLKCSDIFTLLVLNQDIHSIVLNTMGSDLLLRKSLCMKISPSNLSESHNGLIVRSKRSTESCFFQRRGCGEDQESLCFPNIPSPNYCNSCGNILGCQECIYFQKLQDSTLQHLRDCKPMCETCYTRKKYYHGPLRAAEPNVCDWGDRSTHSKLKRPSWYSDHLGFRLQLAGEVYDDGLMNICGGCRWKTSDMDLVSTRQYRPVTKSQDIPHRLELSENYHHSRYARDTGHWMYSHLYRTILCCIGCKKDFVDEKIWWICSWCESECRAKFHEIVTERGTVSE